MSCSHILWSKYEKQNCIYQLHPVSARSLYHNVCNWEFILNHLCYRAERSEVQPLSETTRGVVKAPSVEAPPSVGVFPVFRLPAGSPEVELSLTAWAQLGSPEQLPQLSPRVCPAPGTPPGIVILPSPNIRRCSPLQPHLQSAPHLLGLSARGPMLQNARLCSAVHYQFNALTSFSEALFRAIW